MSKSALFLVQTPLHIHNAREAIISFAIQRPTFLIVTSKHQKKWASMMQSALPEQAECVFCERNDFDLEACTKSYMQHMRKLRESSFDYVFFCDTRLYIFCDIVKSLQNPNTYLMDDGAATIVSIHVLTNFAQYFEQVQSSVAARRLEIEQIKRKYKLWELPQLNYKLFTAFDFVSCEAFEVRQNPMHALSCSHTQVDQQQILFIGQPLVNSGYVDTLGYVKYCGKICEYYGNKKISYLPHPREDKQEAQALCRHLGVALIETELSAEAYLMHATEVPARVCGFYSTALWIIAKFHRGITVDAHRLLLEPAAISKKKAISRSNHLSEFDCIELYYQHYSQRMQLIQPLLQLNELTQTLSGLKQNATLA